MLKRPRYILPLIVFSQFAGTSLWFAGNAVIEDLQMEFGLAANAIGDITSAVQLGFIIGTLTFASFAVSDRFSPRKVFFVCSVLGSLTNLGIFLAVDLQSVLGLRLATGFFLAGIYPVGMQIAAGWYEKGLGRAIGYLVGALVVGTAFPHLIRSLGSELSWERIIAFISILSVLGGVAILVGVPDGPFLKRGKGFSILTIFRIFQPANFRRPALGYFGHMWELYSFWAFAPFFIKAYEEQNSNGPGLDIPLWAFFIIAAGSAGCVVGGIISTRRGSAKVAFIQLAISGLFCLISPILFEAPLSIFLLGLIVWGVVVVGDSPQFSALIARNAQPDLVGTSLTMVNSLGFLLSIPSMLLIGYLSEIVAPQYLFLFLFIGPALGLISMLPLFKSSK